MAWIRSKIGRKYDMEPSLDSYNEYKVEETLKHWKQKKNTYGIYAFYKTKIGGFHTLKETKTTDP